MNADTISTVTERNAVMEHVWALYEALGSWRKVGEKLDVTPIMAWRVAHEGYEPRDNIIRKKLGYREIIEVKVFRNKEGKFSKEG